MARREASLMPDAPASKEAAASGAHASSTPASPSSTSPVALVQLLSSIFFRLIAYLFLRWIPTGLAWPLLPVLYTIYIVTWLARDFGVRRFARQAKLHLDRAGQTKHLAELAEGVKEATQGDPSTSKTKAIEHQAEENGSNLPPLRVSTDGSRRIGPFAFVRHILFGHSSTTSRNTNLVSLALTSLVFLFVLDSFWSPHLFPSYNYYHLRFARVGAVSPTTATIHVRYPFPLGVPEPGSSIPAEWSALVEDTSNNALGLGGSLEPTLRDGATVYNNPEPLRLIYREADVDFFDSATSTATKRLRRWERGPALHLTEASDWTAAVTIDNLWPSSKYEWRLAFAHNNTFTPYPPRPRSFTTWPDSRLPASDGIVSQERQGDEEVPLDDPNYFTFIASSCVRADTPYSPLSFWAWSPLLRAFANAILPVLPTATEAGAQPSPLEKAGNWLLEAAKRNNIKGFEYVAKRMEDGVVKPRFFLSLGDLIYADVPRREKPTLDAFRKHWRNLFASDSFRKVYERIPVLGVYDDHEVSNDWSGLQLAAGSHAASSDDDEDERLSAGDGNVSLKPLEAFAPANQAFTEYVASANPAPLEKGENYWTFRYGNALAGFVLDTRKHRVPSSLSDDAYKTMLGAEQRDALLRWLGAVNNTATFKLVVSSIPFNSLWAGPLGNAKDDTWAGYLTEREALLEVMERVPNTFIISGDRHEFAAVGLRSKNYENKDDHPVWEASISPLSMFYLPVRTLSQEHGLGASGQEKLLRYIPDGTSKHAEFTIDTRDLSAPRMRMKLLVNGEVGWEVEVKGKQVLRAPVGVGGIAKSLLELLGFKRRSWF